VEATRPQPILLEGLSRFLIGHEACGAGFDIAHPSGVGSGRVSITCRACGANHEYATATLEVEREVRIERISAPRSRPAPPTEASDAGPAFETALVVGPGPEPVVERAPVREPATPAVPASAPPAAARSGFPWREHGVTIALFLVALAALAFAAYRVASDDDEEAGPTQPASPAAAAPAEAPGEPQRQGPPPAAVVPEPSAPALETLRTQRYQLRLPPSWTQRQSGGGLRLASPAGRASLTVFFERDPSMSRAEMAASAADFVARRNPGSEVPAPERTGAGAFSVLAATGARRETAVGFLRGDYRYLLMRSETRGAAPAERRQARAVQASFRPR
jgi:hypothetical protein